MTVKITCTLKYCGYPQTEKRYEIETDWVKLKVTRYGNQGLDMPQAVAKYKKCNGYFWDLNAIMKKLYNGNDIANAMLGMKEGETKEIEIER